MSQKFQVWVLALAVLAMSALPVTAAEEMRIEAVPGVHALTGVRIVTAPGETIDSGTVVLRDGIVESVGADVTPPADARLWDHADADPPLTVYPGLIDPYVERPWPEAAVEAEEKLRGDHDNPLVRPERRMVRYAGDTATSEKLRQAGYTVAAVAPEQGLFRGQSAVIGLSAGEGPTAVLVPTFAQNVTFASNSWEEGFPTSLMGAVTLFRQTLTDAMWYQRASRAYVEDPAQSRPPYVSSHGSLEPVATGAQTVVFETDDALDTLRIAGLVEEFDLEAQIVGNGYEYRWLDTVGATGLPHLLPLDFPEPPQRRAEEGEGDPNVELDALRHWDAAPSNPARLIDAGVPVAFTTHRLSDRKQVHDRVRTAIEDGGLTAEQALAAMTTRPAELLDLGDRIGTIEPGKVANLTVVEGELFEEEATIREVWIDGERFEVEITEPPTVEPAGTWELTVVTGDGQEFPVTLDLSGDAYDLAGDVETMGQTIELSSASVSGATVEVAFDGTALGIPGTISMNLTVEGETVSGSGTSPMGPFSVSGRRTEKPDTAEV